MLGEYYVFCRRCSVKVFNTEAKYRDDTGWLCKKHGDEIQEYTSMAYRPTETVFKPKIVRRPRTMVYVDGIESGKYWETIVLNWEDIDQAWEDV